MATPRALEAVEWYSQNRGLYRDLARKVGSIIRDVLESNEINYYSVSSRAKPIDSYKRKAIEGRYEDPRSEIMDMAGVRIITYTDLDAKIVAKLTEELFEIHPEHSVNKTEELGVDRVGYRSIHYVGTLGKDRTKLPENRIYKGLFFEIQIRTILQHAWAEFEHDRNYKFSGVLPIEIKRRFYTLAGTLELLDKEFSGLSKDIDKYILEVGQKTERGELSILIDSKSLREYMVRRFKSLIERGVVTTLAVQVIEELRDMGINKLEELENIIPNNFIEIQIKHLSDVPENENFIGILRNLMMIDDIEKYFLKAWKRHWHGTTYDTVNLLKKYDVDFFQYAKKYDIDVFRI